MEESGVPGENHRPVASHWQTLSHNVVSSTPRHEQSSTTNKTDRHDITEIVLKAALNTKTLTTIVDFAIHAKVLLAYLSPKTMSLPDKGYFSLAKITFIR
jgi:hypothetical protein